MNAALTYVSLSPVVACCQCGIRFAWDGIVFERRRQDKDSWFCPNGHEQQFLGESAIARAERLQRELTVARTRQIEAEHKEALVTLQATRLRERAQNGVCPCCNRSFTNLRRHMATKHPEAK